MALDYSVQQKPLSDEHVISHGDHSTDQIKLSDFSLTTMQFPDFSMFSRRVVTVISTSRSNAGKQVKRDDKHRSKVT